MDRCLLTLLPCNRPTHFGPNSTKAQVTPSILDQLQLPSTKTSWPLRAASLTQFDQGLPSQLKGFRIWGMWNPFLVHSDDQSRFPLSKLFQAPAEKGLNQIRGSIPCQSNPQARGRVVQEGGSLKLSKAPTRTQRNPQKPYKTQQNQNPRKPHKTQQNLTKPPQNPTKPHKPHKTLKNPTKPNKKPTKLPQNPPTKPTKPHKAR